VFAICVESSHARGMGHLFRSLNLAYELQKRGHAIRFLINAHEASLRILSERGHAPLVVDLSLVNSGWEVELVRQLGVKAWINDRLDTDVRHVQLVRGTGISVATFDDRGSGAAASNLNVAALVFDECGTPALSGMRVLRGPEYLVLNPEIARFKRERTVLKSVLVTLGGSDTYGVTVSVLNLLRALDWPITVVLGPGFKHEAELDAALWPGVVVKRQVPSMIQEMARHDLAITGGGVTPFEANAAGLPCIVIANETFEVPVGIALQAMGGCIFAGHHSTIDATVFDENIPLHSMSCSAMRHIGLEGATRVACALEEMIAV
jgi:spore coat polysaccharide biosynthesis predicted glycosyltransferase SpsG